MGEEKTSFQFITGESPEKAEAEAIYNEAFPERERPYSFDELLQIAEESGIFKVTTVAFDGKTIGILCYAERDRYIYGLYFAVKSEFRGGGCGSKLFRAFLEFCGDKPMVGSIETPIPGTSNYTQREKRRMFYERNGMVITKYSYGPGNDPETRFTMISSRPMEDVFEILTDVMKLMMRWMPGPSPDKSKFRFFLTENGRTEELPLTLKDLTGDMEPRA